MKQLILSLLSIVSLNVSSQISDLPVSASPTIICSGDNSNVTLTGSELHVKYSLRNNSNLVIDGPIAGTGNNLTFNTGALTTSETFNIYAEDDYNALAFDGTNQHVNLGSYGRGIDANGLSVGMWIKTSASTGSNQYLASKYVSSKGFIFFIDPNGKLVINGKWSSGIFGSSGPSVLSVNDGNWHFVVGTTDGATWTTYIDGNLASTATTGSPGNLMLGNYANIFLGTYNSGGYYLGEMDDISLWKKILTPAEVASHFTTCLSGSEPDIIGLYHCDQSQATIIDDSPEAIDGVMSATLTTQGVTPCTPATSSTPIQMTQTVTIEVVTINDETLSAPSAVCAGGSATVTTGSSSTGAYYSLIDEDNVVIDGPIAGTGSGMSFTTDPISSTQTFGVYSSIDPNSIISSSLDFDGTDDYVDLSTFHRYVNSQVTVACWVKLAPNTSNQFIVSKYDLNSGFYMVIDANGKARFDVKGLSTTGNQSGPSTTSIDDNEWHYLVGTGSLGGTAKIYVDGILESTSSTSFGGSTFINPSSLNIGSYTTNYSTANIDDLAIWRIELSPAAILANMTNCININDPDLSGYFLMNNGSGGTILDRSYIGIDGIMMNMDPATDWVNGVANGCLIFDDCSMVMTQTVSITVDNNGPIADVATLPDVNGQCEVTSLTAPTASDFCSGSISGTHNATLPITSNTSITWTYDDGDGNTTTQTQNVVINDNTAPIADVASLSDITAQCSVTTLTAPTATDNCASSVITTHDASLPISSNTLITWTYDDGDGNTSTQTQNVVINDNTAPIADVASLSDITAQCSVTTLTTPTATDNCLGSITGTHNASLPIMSSSSVTWTYIDGNGNTTTQVQNVVINDNTAPVPDVATLADVTSECAITSLSNPSATDNCSAVLVSSNASLPISATTMITWTYTDVDGNSSTQTQNIVINDVTAPVPDVASLSDLTAQCQITTLTAPSATDNCAGSIIGTHTALLPLTTSTIVTWTYDDGGGNVVTQLQNVVINDNTLPVADATSLSDLTAACEITSLTPPTATDNCIGAITGTTTTSLPISASASITWSYNDGNGNIATQTQNVIINDNIAPVEDLATLNDINETCEVTSLTAPTASDNCLGSIAGTHNATLPISTSTLITWTYDDGNGNVTTQNQQVNITDAIAPVGDLATLADINETCEILNLTAPTATDNCSGQVVGTHNATLPITSSTLVTWTYLDGNGNSSTQDQQVTITPIDAAVSVSGTTITANNGSADGYQWVDCNNGNAPIAGETNQAFTPTSNGSYAVEVTTGSCTETSPCEAITTIGIDENVLISVKVYPNPAVEVLTISSDAPIREVAIYDVTGSLIQIETLPSFTVSQLANGTYTLRIETDLGIIRKRFVKK